jgi:dienelactone hydrolase
MHSSCLLVAGFLAFAVFAVVPAVAADIQFESGKFDSPDDSVVKVSAKLFRPDAAGPHAAVVLLHTCGGLKQHVTHEWPQFLTSLGYVVLVPDTLGSRGYYKGCIAMRDRFVIQARDAYGALDYLAGQSFVVPGRIAVIGFSMGAMAINEVIMIRAPRPAGNTEFKAFVSLYGRCRDLKPDVVRAAPLLQIIPEKDNYAATCIERSKSVSMEAHVIAGAYHAFDQTDVTRMRPDPVGNPMLYDSGATERARGSIKDFLEKNLK